jgi:hypothetical protein
MHGFPQFTGLKRKSKDKKKELPKMEIALPAAKIHFAASDLQILRLL